MRQRFLEILKRKLLFSRISWEQVEVVDRIPENPEKNRVYFDGMILLDMIYNVEDDIQQVYGFRKDGTPYNLGDLYSEQGGFDEEHWEKFLERLDEILMNKRLKKQG